MHEVQVDRSVSGPAAQSSCHPLRSAPPLELTMDAVGNILAPYPSRTTCRARTPHRLPTHPTLLLRKPCRCPRREGCRCRAQPCRRCNRCTGAVDRVQALGWGACRGGRGRPECLPSAWADGAATAHELGKGPRRKLWVCSNRQLGGLASPACRGVAAGGWRPQQAVTRPSALIYWCITPKMGYGRPKTPRLP